MLFSIDDEFEDDFDDSFDDGLDENFDDSFGEDEDMVDQPQKKKKSPVFTILIILIFVLGAGFMAIKLGLISSTTSTAPVQSAEVTTQQEEMPQAQEIVEEPVQEQVAEISEAFMEEPVEQVEASLDGDVDNFDMFDAGDEQVVEDTANDMFADESTTTNVDTNIDDMFAATNVEEAPVEEVEDAQAEELVFDVQEEQVQEMAFDKPVVTTEVKTQNIETAPSEEILSRLEMIEGRIDGLESVSENVIVQTPTAVDTGALDDLRAEISKLNAEIKKLKAEKKKVQKTTKAVSSAPKKAPVEVVEVKTEKPTIWMIKSAQPGKALLSSNGKGALSVKVGDVLSGVGTIKFIGINDEGLWEVRGTVSSVLEPQ